MIRSQSLSIRPSYGEGSTQWAIHYVHREAVFDKRETSGYEAYSYSLHCPQCKGHWFEARFLDTIAEMVWPLAGVCEQCSYRDDWHPVPGSIFPEFGYGVIDDELLRVLPPELLTREFVLHMKAYTNGSNINPSG